MSGGEECLGEYLLLHGLPATPPMMSGALHARSDGGAAGEEQLRPTPADWSPALVLHLACECASFTRSSWS